MTGERLERSKNRSSALFEMKRSLSGLMAESSSANQSFHIPRHAQSCTQSWCQAPMRTSGFQRLWQMLVVEKVRQGMKLVHFSLMIDETD